MSLAAVFDDTTAKVTITVSSAPTGTTTVHLQRSTDQITWTDVRGAQAATVSAGAAIVTDYEYAPGIPNVYRATYNATASFVAAGATANVGTGTTITPALPAGVATGDLMLLCLTVIAGTPTTPAGWTSLLNSGGNALFWRMRQSGDTAPTVTCVPSGGMEMMAQIAAWRGVNASGLQHVVQANTSAQNVAYPALTALANGVGIIIGRKSSVNTSVTPPAGYTLIGNITADSGSDASQFWFYKVGITAGTVIGPGSVTVAGGAAAVSQATVVAGGSGGQDTVTITPAQTQVWLKSPLRPFLNRSVTVVDIDDITRQSRSGVFDVIGRTLPVAVTDLMSGRSTTLTMRVTDSTDADDLDGLVASGDVLLVQPPSLASAVPTMYAVLPNGMARQRVANTSAVRRFPLPLTEVATPDLTLAAVQSTWQTVINQYATWADLVAAKATWNDVLQLVGTAADVITT